jgi:hypothetical protein
MEKMPMPCRLWLLILLLWAFVGTGCGVKGPPVAPRSVPPPAVTDLAYDILESTLELQWTVPAIASKRDAPFDGCVVNRAIRSFEETQCRTCPIPFNRVADLPVPLISKKGKPARMNYSETLTPGSNYVYKVNCYTENGRFSADSNLIEFDYR